MGHSPCWGVSHSPVPMPCKWHGHCPLSFIVLGALWFLVCKQGVSEGGETATWGTHCLGCFQFPSAMPHMRHGHCPLFAAMGVPFMIGIVQVVTWQWAESMAVPPLFALSLLASFHWLHSGCHSSDVAVRGVKCGPYKW